MARKCTQGARPLAAALGFAAAAGIAAPSAAVETGRTHPLRSQNLDETFPDVDRPRSHAPPLRRCHRRPAPAAAQKPSPPAPAAAAAGPAAAADPSYLTVREKDYVLTVHRPAGWQEDAEGAKKYHGKFLFHPQPEAGKADSGTMLLVSTYHKFDENVSLRLQSDADSFRKQFPNLEQGTVDVKHPKYATYARVFSQPGGFSQYVTYLNPGGAQPYAVYVALGREKGAATPAELAAYKALVESLVISLPAGKPGS